MRITKARLDRYRRELDVLGDSAATYVLEYLSALDSAGVDLSVADIREETILAIEDSLNAFGDQASELACDLFEEVVVRGYGKNADVRLESVIDKDMVEGKVRYLARELVGGKRDEFRRDVADVTRYYVKRSAFENMERNCDRNDVRYARVPSGTETCAFCFMLSSRGFVYRSEETAGSTHSYHPHCNCIIVPGFKGLDNSTQIEGYDPDEMYDRWKACKETIGGDSGLRDLWDGMTPKERSAYKGNSDSERYRRFVNAQTFKEVETRDFRWLNTGKAPKVDYSDNPESEYGRLLVPGDYSPENIVDRGNEWRDLYAHHALSSNGFVVKTFDSKHIDVKINGVWWDVKSPEQGKEKPKPGRELSFIENDVRKAVRQFSKRGMHGQARIVYNPKYRHDASDEEMVAELSRQIKGHGAKEALFITENGGILRIKAE